MWKWRSKKTSEASVEREPEKGLTPVSDGQPESAPQRKAAASAGTGRPAVQTRNQSMPSQMEDVQLPTPPYTSSKTGFNVAPSGRDHDAPRAMNVATNEQFRDEDRFTNATNDPRIGTHGRKYEP